MYDHIGLKVGNLDASVRFYTAALAPLGYVLCSRDETGAGFGPKGGPALWLYLHKDFRGTGAHIAFRAPDHAAIRKFHAEGVKAGGRDHGGAGPRADYSPTYFAAFLIHPEGNNGGGVCTWVVSAPLPSPPSLRAKRSNPPAANANWIASSLPLLAMTA